MIDSLLTVPVHKVPIELMGFKAMSVKGVCVTLFDIASDMLTTIQHIDSSAFIITTNSCTIIDIRNLMYNNVTKDVLSSILRKIANDSAVIGIALMLETWVLQSTKDEIQRTDWADMLPIHDSPDKKEAIIVQCEWHTAAQYILSAQFNRKKMVDNTETIIIQQAHALTNFEGRFANLFPPTRQGMFYN